MCDKVKKKTAAVTFIDSVCYACETTLNSPTSTNTTDYSKTP